MPNVKEAKDGLYQWAYNQSHNTFDFVRWENDDDYTVMGILPNNTGVTDIATLREFLVMADQMFELVARVMGYIE